MAKLVILDLDGTLHQGVTVTLEIQTDDTLASVLQARAKGKLPANPMLSDQYDHWRSLYRSLSLVFRLGDRPNPITRGSQVELFNACRQSAQTLAAHLNTWLAADSFRLIKEQLLEKLDPAEPVRLIVQADDNQLRRLPWHLWNLLQRYSRAEVALSAPAYERVELSHSSRQRLRLLIILGNHSGIDIEPDRQLLAHLPGNPETVFLVEPDRQQLQQQLWSVDGWDILFFAGHSTSQSNGETGCIELNPHDRLSIDELTYGLRKAIARGLKLAIFNSCDGLGLANQLERLHIPQMIVMREPVPDPVAQAFLKYFLTSFSGGQPLYVAVREAREQLQSLENQCPCATWLPIIYQNPTEKPLLWPTNDKERSTLPHLSHPSYPPTSHHPSPYRGLSAFQETDAPFFFGREALVRKLVNRVQQRSLLAVIGPSGSGKSSLVFAGLLPKLRSQGHWQIIAMRPGNRPFLRLAEQLIPLLEPLLSETDQLVEINKLAIALQMGKVTLADVGDRILQKMPQVNRLLLVADQFEELYTLCREPELRQAFQNNLLQAIEQKTVTLVLTLRADFCEHALAYRPFAEALRQFPPELLGPMTRAELQAAIEKPALQLGVSYADGLTERILDAVEAAPGHLPLLEFALTLLWERQQNGCLSHAAYDAIGGVEQALTGHAEQVYSKLDETAQRQAQRIFTQLVRPGDGTADTRRLATRSEIREDRWHLVTHLADARLIVSRQNEATGEESAEIAHEALIQEWQRLRQWLEGDRSFRTWQERLRSTIRQWETSQHDEGALLRGAPLLEAQHWFEERQLDLSQVEQQFIKASLTLKSQEKATRDRQRRYRMMGLSSGITAALLLSGVALWQWHRAEIVQANVQLDALSTSADELFASGKQLEALLEGVRAGRQLYNMRDATTDARIHAVTALLQVVYGIYEYNRLDGHERTVISVSISPDGQLIATGSDDATVKLWQHDGTLLATLKGHGDRVRSVAFSPDSQLIASASYDRSVRLWRRDGTAIAILNGHTDKVNSVAFSPDGNLLMSGSADSTIKLWRPSPTGAEFELRPYATLTGHRGWVSAVSISPDGQLLASASTDGTVKLWQRNGTLLTTLSGPQTSINSVAFSPDGQTLAAGINNGTTWLWTRSGQTFTATPSQILQGHSNRVWGVSFSANSETLATASADNTVRLWQRDGTPIVTLEGHNSSVYSVSFSPDGTMLASASADSTVKLWHPRNNPLAVLNYGSATAATSSTAETPTRTTAVSDVSFSPDGQQLVVAGAITASIWRSLTGSPGDTLDVDVQRSSLMPLQANSSEAVLNARWHNLSDREALPLVGHQDTINRVSFSPNSQLLATASSDTTVKLWTFNGTLLQTLESFQTNVLDVSFSPNGQLLATANDDNTIRLWRRGLSGEFASRSHQRLAEHSGHVSSVSFSPDGQLLASSSEDNTVKLWQQQNGTFETQSYKTLVHSSGILDVTFSPNGQLLASASRDGNALLWQQDGTLLATLRGHRDRINRIIFSPDGQTIVTASADETIKLWNLNGTLLRTLRSDSSNIRAIAFSPDGQTLAAATNSGTVIFWNFDLNDLLTKACSWVNDYLQTNTALSESDRQLCLTD